MTAEVGPVPIAFLARIKYQYSLESLRPVNGTGEAVLAGEKSFQVVGTYVPPEKVPALHW
jgi:hypothetical protein